MSLLNVYCEECREHIAIVDTDELVYPATGSMFRSPDEKHGIAPPFAEHPWAGWDMMFCPHGRRHRISGDPTYIVTEGMAKLTIPSYGEVIERGKQKNKEVQETSGEGEEVNKLFEKIAHNESIMDNLPSKTEEIEEAKPVEGAPINTDFLCRVCGKQFKNKFGLTGHMRSHKPGELE